MKKLLVILLSILVFAPAIVEAVKEKGEQREQKILSIIIKCPVCNHSQTIACKNNAYYFVQCGWCNNKLAIDTRGGLDYIQIERV